MTRYSHGRPYYIYEAGNRRNEPLDIRVYALAAHRRLTFDTLAIRAEMAAMVKPDAPTTAPVPEPAANQTQAQPERIVGNIVVERAPRPQPTAILPAYVPMSQRRGAGGTGESMYSQ
jgi:phage terminase large subunit GpA-like protein